MFQHAVAVRVLLLAATALTSLLNAAAFKLPQIAAGTRKSHAAVVPLRLHATAASEPRVTFLRALSLLFTHSLFCFSRGNIFYVVLHELKSFYFRAGTVSEGFGMYAVVFLHLKQLVPFACKPGQVEVLYFE